MNSKEIDKALEECREKLADRIWYENVLKEEITELRQALLAQHSEVAAAYSDEANKWREECIKIQNSFSWKVTKPLRLVKEVVRPFRTYGIKVTIRKMIDRLRKKWL